MYAGDAADKGSAARGEELLTVVVGIGGHLGAGKDEIADRLVAVHDFVKIGMSDPLAEALYILNPRIYVGYESSEAVKQKFIAGQIYFYQEIIDDVGYVEAKTISEVRRWLQVLGTEVGRELIDKNVWVTAARKKISQLRAEGKSVVITGIRFPNELDMLKADGHISMYVFRPGHGGDQHASENSISPDDFVYHVYNGGNLQDLYNATDDFVDWLKGLGGRL